MRTDRFGASTQACGRSVRNPAESGGKGVCRFRKIRSLRIAWMRRLRMFSADRPGGMPFGPDGYCGMPLFPEPEEVPFVAGSFAASVFPEVYAELPADCPEMFAA